MRRGYARVSTGEQDVTVQRDRLLLAHCDRLYQDKLSGEDDRRPALQQCLADLEPDDVLVIVRIDRLARSMPHLYHILEALTAKGATLEVLEQGGVDLRTPEGRLAFGILGIFAAYETELRRARQREGLAKARQRGTHLGRQKALSPAQAYDLRRRRAAGETIRQLMYHFGIKKTTVYQYLRHAPLPEEPQAAD